jgi:itaconyl-CoA hydratase
MKHFELTSACTEMLAIDDPNRDNTGTVHSQHWGVDQNGAAAFELQRRVLVKRRSHWDAR